MSEVIICPPCLFQSLILLVIANGAPIGAGLILQGRLAMPVDGCLKLCDGHPLFGVSKTWRGVFSSILLTSLAALFLDIGALSGVRFALLTMTGDLASSFCKRRLGLSESSRARGIDTLPESVLPTVLLKDALDLSWADIMIVTVVFLIIEEYLSPLLYRWHIRKKPY